ncbi:MAG: DUF1016 N-terminal domain-containing protein, partial [Candidatus Omnitrophica bacterium]|nr:DUF1016 N-terminal domain-containing protein [Candidatus Omnitrophota bacterium]
MKNELTKTGYGPLLAAIKERIRKAQHQALRTVNRELIALYWDIGRMILKRQTLEGWGLGVVEKIAQDLKLEFPENRGFSAQNLWRMRQFYETYRQTPILSAALRELPWTHNLLIMNKTSTDRERAYYIRASAEHRWSSRELERQLKTSAFKRSQENHRRTILKLGSRNDAVLTHFRNEYVLDLVGLKDRH